MEHGDQPERESGDDGYPVAPLPPHERVWRHPSELGNGQMMVAMDPPPVLGKGMAIGAAVLALVFVAGLTRLMVPGDGTSDIAVSVTAASQRITVPGLAIDSTDAPAETSAPVGSTLPSTTTLLGPPATLEPMVPSTTLVPITDPGVESTAVTVSIASTVPPVSPAPVVTTVAPPRTALIGTDDSDSVAIEVQRGVLYVTTSAAVGTARSAPVVLDDGSTVDADVMIVDEDAGIAVLVVNSDAATSAPQPSLPTGSSPTPGQTVTVMSDGQEPTDGVLGSEAPQGGGVELIYDETATTIGEGAPVLDEEGNLVGLCTESGERMWVVPATALVEAVEASLAVDAAAPWLGISGERIDSGGVLVSSVATGSPAETALMAVGDVIVGFDGHTVLSMSELAFDMAAHQPGDEITITVQRNGVDVDLVVVLGVRPPGA